MKINELNKEAQFVAVKNYIDGHLENMSWVDEPLSHDEALIILLNHFPEVEYLESGEYQNETI